MVVLAVNCGSSSLKYLVADMSGAAPRRLLEGKSEADPETAQVDELLAALDREGLGNRIAAVGHRVVHGGDRFTEPVRIDDRVLDELDQLSALAPLHNPRAVATIRALRDRLGSATPQVATFDTAFHARMPATATTYAVPRRWRDELGVRRYGFHGLAHRYMAERAAQLLGRSPAATRLVTLQLGNGCSVAAIAGGRSVETSMGLTPNEGLVMGTRSGDVSPDVVDFVARRTAGNPLDLIAELTKEAGLLGLAGAGDVRELEERQQRGDRDSALALEVFCHRARRYLGGYLALLGGADAVVFGGGIGENSPGVREGIAGGLDALGITLDPVANADVRGSEARISSGASRVAVYVVTVDEDLEICRDTVAALAR